MTNSEDLKKALHEQYSNIGKNSLIKVQYSCSGNDNGLNEPDYIPIIPEPEKINYSSANEEDIANILRFMKENKLPVSDVDIFKQQFIVASFHRRIIGCVAIEIFGKTGLLRSLAVDISFRNWGIGKKLMVKADALSNENRIKNLYLLTTTASEFFLKNGWSVINRDSVPEEIACSTEFAFICPSTAVCMMK